MHYRALVLKFQCRVDEGDVGTAQDQPEIRTNLADSPSDIEESWQLRGRRRDPDRGIVGLGHVFCQGVEIVLNPRQVEKIDPVPLLLKARCHLQDPEADEDAFIQKECRGRRDEADRRTARHFKCGPIVSTCS